MRRKRRDLREQIIFEQQQQEEASNKRLDSGLITYQVSNMRSQTHVARRSKKLVPSQAHQWSPTSPPMWILLLSITAFCDLAITATQALKFDPDSNAYTGLTFTFDPRLDKRVEMLHFEHWLSIMQQTSSLMHESLNGRAHLQEVRVLIPYKWRNSEWPVLHKPGAPIIMNRRLRYTDSDVIVGFEDPIYKETPFAVQHDECSKQGLHIQMPISFLDHQTTQLEPKLKARLLMREFASHRYGIFKESGFRQDPMYPPVPALPGCLQSSTCVRTANRSAFFGGNRAANVPMMEDSPEQPTDNSSNIRGFDEHWQECQFALPNGSSNLHCVPYLARANSNNDQPNVQLTSSSFNLMNSDPFSYSPTINWDNNNINSPRHQPVEWRQVADVAKWHFCGENFVPPPGSPSATGRSPLVELPSSSASEMQQHFQHNQLVANKQNIMCNERSALNVIQSSEDFRSNPFRPSTFNRLPATTFRYLQEMPPRLLLCVEYAAHLYQSRRQEHGILESAIGKFLAYDLIADTELSLILFGQQQSTRLPFKRLDSSVDSRLTLYSPPIDPYDEPPAMYTDQELAELNLSPQTQQLAKLVKGTCSFAKLMAEISAALQQRSLYDDVGSDIVILTSGLFIEEESKIEELLRNAQAAGLLRTDSVNINLIIYPAAMLFDTKSRRPNGDPIPGLNALDSKESEAVLSNRLGKLQLIERLAGARLHFVREQLDANGNVKMSTLVQFYKIFEHLSRGHSWDQTHSWSMVGEQHVETSQSHAANGSTRLTFHFDLDASGNNELIVGFIDPKQHQQSRSGKRFAIKNLQLRSPGGHLVMADSAPWSLRVQPSVPLEIGGSLGQDLGQAAEDTLLAHADQQQQHQQSSASGSESALFPYRAQLSLAGFHLRAAHLAPLNSSHKLAGTWTLTGTSDEPMLQTNAVALLRANPVTGDTITARCWVQTYHQQTPEEQATGALKQVKVFVQTMGAAKAGPVQEVEARMEVQDELGNIVQNANMLDDGLGAPDMTRGDGIHTAQVQRAERPGYYRVSVELSGSVKRRPLFINQHPQDSQPSTVSQQGDQRTGNGQDAPCCGSFVPPPAKAEQRQDTRHLSRQLYCGTFHVDSNNKLAQQRPPRINNISVVGVDPDQRLVTLRWFEPSLDIATPPPGEQMQQDQALESAGEPLALRMLNHSARHHPDPDATDQQQQQELSEDQYRDYYTRSRGLLVASGSGPSSSSSQHRAGAGSQVEQPLSSRYEIKLFDDRQALKRAFDSKQVGVGYRFQEWDVAGPFSNLSTFGGVKELTLRIPYKHDEAGVYYLALKVYNNLDVGSPLSPIVEFWLRNNLTQEEAEARYGPLNESNRQLMSGDLSGGSRAQGNQFNYLLARGTVGLDNLSLLVFIGVAAFVFSVVCFSLVACLTSPARRSLSSRLKQQKLADDEKAVAGSSVGNGAGSGSSVVSGGCSSGSSRESEVASSAGGSQCGGHDVELGAAKLQGLSPVDQELHYNTIQQQHALQQHQAQLIQAQLMAGHLQQQEVQNYNPYNQDIYSQQQQQPQYSTGDQQDASWLQHTMVNGYAYATVQQQQQQQQQAMESPAGDLAQNGLAPISPVQSWPADVLLSHYDKVKQARERNEAPPVMRIENMDHKQFGHDAGLATLAEQQGGSEQSSEKNSYLVRQQRNQVPSYFNLQLQQQLSSVLKSKQQRNSVEPMRSSPALEGVRELEAPAGFGGSSSAAGSQVAPPPQYVYCTPMDAANNSGLQQPATDPSIYSQATHLQQVDNSSYYANHQWQPSQQQIYSTTADSQQRQPRLKLGGGHQQGAEEEDYADEHHQSNSAISEV